MGVLEKNLRQLFRDGKRFPPGTASLCEPGLGSDTGLPDVWLLNGSGFSPLELKRGVNPLSNFEPSQRKFHKLSLLRGCPTYCLSIVDEDECVGFQMALRDTVHGTELVAIPRFGMGLEELNYEFLLRSIRKIVE